MTFLDLVRLAASNLWRRKMRTFLTILGVIIGTACITIMVALGIGNLEQFNESIMQNSNLTQIQIYSGGGGANAAKLNENAIVRFKEIPGVKSATGVLSIPSYMVMGKYTCSNSVSAIDPEAMSFDFSEGSLFSDTDAIELVIGSNARQWFTDPRQSQSGSMMGVAYAIGMSESGESQQPVGPDVDWLEQKLKYYPSSSDGSGQQATPDNPSPKEYKARITGILAAADNMESYNIYMSLPAAQKLIRENKKLMDNAGVKADVYANAYVNAETVDDVASILQTVKDMGFQAYSDTEWITQMQGEQARQQSQLIAIGLISLLVSAIGIANTMLASILERKREIGVMKVIGLSISKINLMFLVEAAMIGLLGGLIGLAISYILGGIMGAGGGEMNFLGMYFSEGVRMSIPWWLFLGAIAIATSVGIVSGIYPAWKATKMSPLEAIRGGE